MMRRALVLLASSTLLASVASALDTIRLVDGKTIPNVQVVTDGLKEVTYKDGKGDKTVPSDTVDSIEYEKKPQELLDVEGHLLTEDLESAVDTLDTYVKALNEKKSLSSAFKWAPAFAAWRAIELRRSAADLEGVKSSADGFIAQHTESRYLPLAYLAKADAELRSGGAAGAKKTLEDLAGLVSAQSLPKRWELEAKLGQVQADDKQKQDARRTEYERLAGEASGIPGVQARARLLIGESFMAEAAASPAAAKDLRTKARAEFDKVLASEGVSRETLAGAHVGLGEALFLLGADVADAALLQEAALSFLRVATLYRDQGATVAKALYYAMRCFDLQQDARRKAEMRRELLSFYPTSSWAAEAKK